MKNINEFRVDAFIETAIKEKKQELALRIYNNAVRMSPVDTGFFRGSWNCSSKTIERATGRGVMNDNAILAVAKDAATYEDIYISNSVDYAQELENGSSKQAPQGILKNARFIALRQMN